MHQINTIKAESRASKLLERFPLAPGGNLEDLAYAMGIDVLPGDFEKIDAWLVRRKTGRSIIRVRAGIREEGRHRFSIAHELGHWELHSDRNQNFLCTGENMIDYRRSSAEAEANLFAAHLLMPQASIPKKVRASDPNFALVGELTGAFLVTLTAAARRLLDLTIHPLILVLSREGRVVWSVSNNKARRFFLESDSPIPRFSLTAEALNAGKSADQMERIEPETWFPDQEFERDSELFEDVRYSSHYKMALTLLWLPG